MQLRIAVVNLAFDPSLPDAGALLDAYRTLTGWSRALSGAGALVTVVQRFREDARQVRDGIGYRLVADGKRGMPRPWDRHDRLVAVVAGARPEAVHVNGLMFPGALRGLRGALGARTPIVLQDHSGALPRRLPWPAGAFARGRWRRAFQEATACTFTARELAVRWHRAGLPRHLPVFEIPEASTDLAPIDRAAASARTGIDGSPVILWVGRFDANKDPLTVLAAIERALPSLPDARVVAIAGSGPLAAAVRARIAGSPLLTRHLSVVGAVPHHRMHEFYSAADLFVSGSHHEGSGYALIEAMACGVTPCVTDIPAFRALTGSCGTRWPVGRAAAGARAIVDAARGLDAESRTRVRAHFHTHVGWDVVGARTLAVYRTLVEAPS
jgi:glycosyltransferase involved in cell wall biosynthesis